MKNYRNIIQDPEELLNSLSYSLHFAEGSADDSGSFHRDFVTSLKCLQKQIFFVFLFMLISYSAFANNIDISNVSLTGQNTTYQFTKVQLDISWEKSWRTNADPINWDAAWVFVKFKVNNYISSAGATNLFNSIAVTSTAGLRVGMLVGVTSGTGVFYYGTSVTAINSGTTFTVSQAPFTPLSGDAVVTGYANWEHATLSSTASEHTAPAGSTITPASEGTGAFIYRSDVGTGTFSKTGVQLRWNYGTNGITDGVTVAIKVFAIEMVYVPQGSFYAGSGGTETGSFTNGSWTSGSTIPLSISSEGALTVVQSSGNLWYDVASGNSGDRGGPIPAGFPKGYNAFYCMKYEIMQQQYVDFLNTLTYGQQYYRTANAPSSSAGTGALVTGNSYRNGTDIMTSGADPTTPAVYACNLDGDGIYGESNDGKYIACNYLSWGDVTAYLDWSGLRPMTELEFEKACRGTVAPVPNEYAWGTIGIAGSPTPVKYILGNNELPNEVIATNYSITVGNAVYSITAPIPIAPYYETGPMRVGIFAATPGNTGRVTSGATYYGIMEMSGNLWECPVTVGNPEGRAFTGTHGNGLLDATGNADATNWPGISAVGAGCRGGGYSDWRTELQVSSRYLAAYIGSLRSYIIGGRGVRSAP